MISESDKRPNLSETEAEERLSKLSTVLRRLGVLVLVSAAISFLIQGWAGWDTISRFYNFLGFAAILAMLGFVLKRLLGDEYGALALVALATSFIPIHFSQLGALTYSLMGDPQADLPKFLVLVANSPAEAMHASLLALVVSVPTAFFGFYLLSAPQFFAAITVFFLGNFALLIPTRSPEHILIIGGVLFLASVVADLFYLSREKVYAVRLILYLPFLILLGRSCVYGYSDFLMCLVMGCLGGYMFSYASTKEDSESKSLLQLASLLPITLAWRHLITGLLSTAQSELLLEYRYSFIYLPLSGIIFILSLRAGSQGINLRRISAVVTVVTVLFQLYSLGSLGSALLCIIMSILVLSLAFTFEEKVLFYLGSLSLAIGLLFHTRYAMHLFETNPWISLSVIGLFLVMASSLVSRYYMRIISQLSKLRNRIDGWR
jgi:hypothetical protein